MDITDTEAVWNMLMEPITIVDIGNVDGLSRSQLTKQNLYMYREPDKSSKIVGEITNLSQGLRVIEHLDNGWSLVECYSSSFISKPATKIQAWNILVSGYIESKYLKQVEPTDKLALVVDKLAQAHVRLLGGRDDRRPALFHRPGAVERQKVPALQ